MTKKIAVVGGGAAGYFAACRHKELFPHHEVSIFEKTSKTLGKVKISGGGRCNVTHACYIPKELVWHYPRGQKELVGPFHVFQPADTCYWFESRGVALKTEADGRIFPVSDNSQSIIDCLEQERLKLGIRLKLKHELIEIKKQGGFNLVFEHGEEYRADSLIITTGSSERIWKLISGVGHTVQPPVPSLFTFNISDERLVDVQGVSWPMVNIRIRDTKFNAQGPLLITHWGLSGPAVLKLSAFAARYLAEKDYHSTLSINFLYPHTAEDIKKEWLALKNSSPNRKLNQTIPEGFTSRIWNKWLGLLDIGTKTWQDLSVATLGKLAEQLTEAVFVMQGKSTFKEEFVTAGGIQLKEVDMKTMESKLCPGLYFAGEVLDIDALTGGFNFQAAWTTGWIAGSQE